MTATDSNDHETSFTHWDEATQLVHLIEHGHVLDELRRVSDGERDSLHWANHCNQAGPELTPPDQPAQADKAVQMAAALREHLHAGRWAEVYACADWLGDLAAELKSHTWAAHPEARPETW